MPPRPSSSKSSETTPDLSPADLTPTPTSPQPPELPGAEDSSTGSETGSPTSNGGRWAVNVGPAFDDPNRPQPDPDAGDEDDEPAEIELWDEERVRPLLQTQGRALHFLVGVGEDDWIHTENDLDAIAPPLTRMLNRYDVTRAAAIAGDEINLGTALAMYAGKNYVKRRRILAERDAAPVPITGRRPDPQPAWTPQHTVDPDAYGDTQ